MDQVIVQVHPSQMNIMVRKLTGNKKRANCLATLLQNELNSDVASFRDCAIIIWRGGF